MFQDRLEYAFLYEYILVACLYSFDSESSDENLSSCLEISLNESASFQKILSYLTLAKLAKQTNTTYSVAVLGNIFAFR